VIPESTLTARGSAQSFIAFVHDNFCNHETGQIDFPETRRNLMKPTDRNHAKESTDTRIAPRPVRAGDKVARDSATASEGKVYLGDAAPVFQG
jgi:hypothetical protein